MSAILSPCGTYRYVLTRQIQQAMKHDKPCLFVMLNPSTADAELDDPTIRRCIGFAKRELCTELTVVNLYALRATNPQELFNYPDTCGPDNNHHFIEQVRKHEGVGIIIAAWGAHKAVHYAHVHKILRRENTVCLGKTAAGHPRHPLYVKADQPLIPWP